MRAGLTTVALAAALLAGCSDDEERQNDPAADVRAAARAYADALAAGDTARACGQLAPAALRDLEAASDAPCPEALRTSAPLPREDLDRIRRELVGAPVAVRGDSATIGPVGAAARPLRLVRVQGRWRVGGP